MHVIDVVMMSPAIPALAVSVSCIAMIQSNISGCQSKSRLSRGHFEQNFFKANN